MSSSEALLEPEKLEDFVFWNRFVLPSVAETSVSYNKLRFVFNHKNCECFSSHEKPSRIEVVTSFKATNNPIKEFAEKTRLPTHDWKEFSKDGNYQLCKEFDIGLVVSFGHLIPENIINSFDR